MPTKIAIIGAGSRSFGPAIIRDILLSDALCSNGVELALMDIVAGHLTHIPQYAHAVNDRLKRTVSISATTVLADALRGAHYVIVAIEVDRYRYWSQDFHIPRKYGFAQVYGENGGPGGMFHALRNMGPVLHIAKTMEQVCPNALMLNFSNPEHKLCEAVSRLSNIRALGLCHGVFIGRGQILEILGRRLDEVEFQACGINHFTWFQRIADRASGADFYPELKRIEREASWMNHWHDLGLGRILMRTFGLWPSPSTNHYGEYIRWASEMMATQMHFYYDAMEGEPWRISAIPEFVYTIDGVSTHRPWRAGPPSLQPDPLSDELKPSGEVAVPIMEGMLLNDRRFIDAVNVRNNGAIPGLPNDAIVEVPATADKAGICPLQMDPLPEGIAAMMRTHLSIHALLVQAFSEQSKNALLQAILLDPTVDSYRNAVGMMNEMIELQKDMLPQLR